LQTTYPDQQMMPLGVVIRRSQGVTRWARTIWRATAVLPGAGPADWHVLRSEEDVTEFHAATLPLNLYVSDTEAYVHELGAASPSVYVILRDAVDGEGVDVILVTASPYEAQDYADSAEEIVEKVVMPPALRAWVQSFVDQHHEEEAFVKRKRSGQVKGAAADGIGDARISKLTDVYSVPRRAQRESVE